MIDEKPTSEVRLALLEQEAREVRASLNKGAESFAGLRNDLGKSAVKALLSLLGMVISVAVSVGGVLYSVGKEAAQREFTSSQAQRTEKLLGDTREEVRLLQTKVEVSETMLRAEQDRRAALEQTIRALGPRRNR
jgi:hypothetical protein